MTASERVNRMKPYLMRGEAAALWQLHFEYNAPLRAINALIRKGLRTPQDLIELMKVEGEGYHTNITGYGYGYHYHMKQALQKAGFEIPQFVYELPEYKPPTPQEKALSGIYSGAKEAYPMRGYQYTIFHKANPCLRAWDKEQAAYYAAKLNLCDSFIEAMQDNDTEALKAIYEVAKDYWR